ncbi:MAG: hypothetical protein ACRECJ_00695 [Limisphaerales bacterium]
MEKGGNMKRAIFLLGLGTAWCLFLLSLDGCGKSPKPTSSNATMDGTARLAPAVEDEPGLTGAKGIIKLRVSGTSPATSRTMHYLISLPRSGGPSAVGSSSLSTVDSVTLTEAKVVFSRIEFKNVEGGNADFRFREPLIVALNLAGAEQNLRNFVVSPGTFDLTRFDIHKLDENDTLPFNQNPDMQDLSVRVTGFLNGITESTFVFTSSIDEEVQKQLAQPFSVQPGETTTVVFQFDTSRWFVFNNLVLDPRDRNNRDEIENNIKTAFEAFAEGN